MVDKTTSPADGEAVVETPETTPDPAAVEPQTTEATSPETPEAEKKGTEEGDAKRPSRFNLRISQLVNQRRESDARADAAIRRAEAAERRLQALEGRSKEDLDYDQREALRLEATMDRREARTARDEAEEHANASVAAMANAVAIQLEEANDPALEPILNDPHFPMTDDVTAFLARTDQAVAIAKHLSQNRKLATQLAKMTFRGNAKQRGTATVESLIDAGALLARLEAQFKNGATAQPRTTTSAPPPGTTLKGGSPPATVDFFDLAKKEDASDYLAAWAIREKQRASQRG